MEHLFSLFDGRVGVWAVVGTALSLVTYRPLARRVSCTPPLVLLTLLSAVFVVLVTVANRGIDVSDAAVVDQLGWWLDGVTLPSGRDVPGWLFNVVLFVPVALFASLCTRRPWVVAGVLVVLSFLVETAQSSVLTGRPDLLDVAANGLGALIGALFAHRCLGRAEIA